MLYAPLTSPKRHMHDIQTMPLLKQDTEHWGYANNIKS
jgi:hypothetical protein